MKKFIYYLPRILSILIVSFLALFILEGFSPGFGWQDSLMHLLMALIALGATIVAWKWPKIGGWIFVLLGLKFLLMIFREPSWNNGMIIGGIPLLIGILFVIEGFRNRDKNKED
ncbi:MAG: hypothetical protein MUP69_04370 [Candidatus Atribacteria bacterium]|nr:hypothetical protein [Candidatus Atribacteria bacterium]